MKRVLSAAVFLLFLGHGLSAQDAHRRAQQVLAASQPPPVATASATDAEIRTALGLAPSTAISRVGDSAAFGVFSNLGVITPVVGTQFLAMSTGVAGTQSPQPGVDYGPFGESGDQATVTLGLQVPPGVTKLTFSYRFMSAEFPEYVGTIYNDTITVHVTQNGVTSEVARSNVNSAAFFPASQSNAGGSGYDIVDGFGQPDAGLTNWLPVTVPVTGGTNVTVQFLIADVGDGIYDSQVLISRFALGALEIVDPNPDLRGSNPTFVTTDIDKLAERGTIRRGAAADGVSRLLLRATPSGGSTVRFNLIDSAGSQDGALIPIGGGTPTTNLQVPVVNTIKGPRAFAIYLAPENFEKAGYENAGERPVNLRVTSGVGGTEVTDTQLIVARPPVLFVHGVWSGENLAPYASQVLLTDPRFIGRTYVPSYQSTNASHFSTNIPRYKDWSQTVLKQLRDGGIAATQVDVVAHSMGGLLARAYANSGVYLRADNYQQGDFNRVISLNSPHSGSPLANILMDFDANPIFGGLFRWAAEQIGKPVHLGAIEDLQEGSTAITGIGTASVQGHAVGGTGAATSSRP